MTMQWDKAGSFPVQYEDVNVKAFFEIFARDLVGRLDLTPADRLLDIATGTGIVVRTARDRVAGPRSASSASTCRPRCWRSRVTAPATGSSSSRATPTQLPFAGRRVHGPHLPAGAPVRARPARGAGGVPRVTSGGGRIAVACWRSLDHQKGASAIADAARGSRSRHGGGGAARRSLSTATGSRSSSRDAGFDDVDVAEVTLDSRYASAQELVDGFATGTPLGTRDPEPGPRRRRAVAREGDRSARALRDRRGARAADDDDAGHGDLAVAAPRGRFGRAAQERRRPPSRAAFAHVRLRPRPPASRPSPAPRCGAAAASRERSRGAGSATCPRRAA